MDDRGEEPAYLLGRAIGDFLVEEDALELLRGVLVHGPDGDVELLVNTDVEDVVGFLVNVLDVVVPVHEEIQLDGLLARLNEWVVKVLVVIEFDAASDLDLLLKFFDVLDLFPREDRLHLRVGLVNE